MGECCTSIDALLTSCRFVFCLAERGYLTSYSANNPALGTWQYRLMGFKDPPTDFYPRPFYTMVSSLLKGDMCLGFKTISKVPFDYIREVFATFKTKFKFFFTYNGKTFGSKLGNLFRWSGSQ